MCPARFFEVCEGDFSICVSSQKTKHSVTHRHTPTAQNSKPRKRDTALQVSPPLNPPKCEQTPSERRLTGLKRVTRGHSSHNFDKQLIIVT